MIAVHARGAKRVHLTDVDGGIPLCAARIGADRVQTVAPATCPSCRAIARDRKATSRQGYAGDLGTAPFVSIKIARGSGGRPDFQVVIPYGASKAEVNEVHELALLEWDRLNRDLPL